MPQKKRNKAKVDPLTGAEQRKPAAPLKTARGKQPNATNVIIPGTGKVVRDIKGKEAKRVITT